MSERTTRSHAPGGGARGRDMVGLRLNRPAYWNDVAEEIRLFLGLSEIVPAEEDGAEAYDPLFELTLEDDGGAYRVLARAGGQTGQMRFTLPADASALLVKKLEKRYLKLTCYDLLKRLYPDVPKPWGSLTGIRPTKLFRELTQEGGLDYARNGFTAMFDVSPRKAKLAEDICGVQEPYIASVGQNDVDVYIGIPFCRTRCLYCSFAAELARDAARLTAYLDALRRDIAHGAALCKRTGRRVRALYVGGGTPTVLSAAQLMHLLSFAFECYGGFGLECTVEAGRPDTIDAEKLSLLRRLGVGRVSINPQSMNDETLLRVGRTHTANDTARAFSLAREAGFQAINMDLIAGLPGETVFDMARTCEAVAKLAPDNLTVHALALKRASTLKTRLAEHPLPEPDAAREMIDIGAACADVMGMRAYYLYRQKYMSGNLENVGYALPGRECRYNIDMMEETISILSHGAGAMSKRVYGLGNRIERLPNPKDVDTYLAKLDRLLAEKDRLFDA